MTHKKQQQGMVLVIGLVLLVALTLMGVMAVKMTTMDERISANNQFRMLTFQAAESVLSNLEKGDGMATLEPCADEPEKNCAYEGYSVGADPESTEDDRRVHQVEAWAKIIADRDGQLLGNSIGYGGGAKIKYRVLDVEASAIIEGTNAQALHAAGLGQRVVPDPHGIE